MSTGAAPVAGLDTLGAPSAEAACSAALDGRSVEAARLADAVLAGEFPPAEQARAATVLATVMARRGMLARAAELHTWAAGVAPDATSDASSDATSDAPACAGSAAVALVGVGVRGSRRAAPTVSAPTLRGGAEQLLARGVERSVEPGASAGALSDLTRATATLECLGAPALHDDSPAALGALVALHRGEADLAAALLDRALAAGIGGPALRRRHLLLRAWAAMSAGDLAGARERLAVADGENGSGGENGSDGEKGAPDERDALVAVALEAGLARRSGDTRALLGLWARARETVLRHAVDLWSLLPLGELLVVAARLGEGGWLAPHATDAEELLAALDEPPLWAAPWHWCGFLAAVAVDDPQDATRRAARLRAAADAGCGAPRDGVAPVLATAAECWLAVLGGAVDPDAVTTTATGLRDAGMPFDAARLAKEAAVRTTDRRAVAALLALARAALAEPGRAATPEPERIPDGAAVEPAPAGRAPVRSPLSEREREVAALLLEGMTYREIGDRLFISAKTVEHHVGRMRQRLGSESRTALFADLRAAVAD